MNSQTKVRKDRIARAIDKLIRFTIRFACVIVILAFILEPASKVIIWLVYVCSLCGALAIFVHYNQSLKTYILNKALKM